jgi:hypothetical protein
MKLGTRNALPGLALVAAIACGPSLAAASHGGLDFLLGDWTGTGSGEPGRGSGSFSFKPDLQDQVLVRRAHSAYPASAGRPAIVHDDLLVVHSGGSAAVYFDNEGHVIHYRVTADNAAKSATFVSVDPSPAPLFRLTYTQGAPGQLRVKFEIAPSGQAADLKTYLDGVVTRRKTRP